MINTKRLLFLLLCAMIVLVLFAACDQTVEATSPPLAATDATLDANTKKTSGTVTEVPAGPTEPLPTEILSWEQDGFYIGDSVRIYDRQGNLLKEEKDFRYQDGSTETGFTSYDGNSNVTEEQRTQHFADGTLHNYYHRQFDCEGNLIDYKYEYYFDNKSLASKGHEFYDSEQGVWNIVSEHYYQDGTPSQIWDGIFETQGGGLIEGIRKLYHDNGNLEEDCQTNPDRSGYRKHYQEDGTPISLEERIFDTTTNTLKTISLSHQSSDGSLYHNEYEHTFDTDGNVVKQISYAYDDSSTDFLNYKQITEFQYDTHGDISWSSMKYYDSSNDSPIVYDEAFYQSYNVSVKCNRVLE